MERTEFGARRTKAPPIAGAADVEYETKLDAQRVSLEFGQKSTRKLDAGRRPIDEAPLFGDERQKKLWGELS